MSEIEPLLALRGGLRGRFHSSLDRLGDALEILELYSDTKLPIEARDLRRLAQIIDSQMSYLRRLGDFASDVALASMLPEFNETESIDLVALAKEVCRIFNEESLARNFSASASLRTALSARVAKGSKMLFCGILANLLSNSLQADPKAVITIEITGEEILYRDSGAGLPQDACDLLLEGEWSERLLYKGGLGLLLIRNYAEVMGWQISAHAGAPMEIALHVPPCEGELGVLLFESPPANEDELRRYIVRELEAVLQDSLGSAAELS